MKYKGGAVEMLNNFPGKGAAAVWGASRACEVGRDRPLIHPPFDKVDLLKVWERRPDDGAATCSQTDGCPIALRSASPLATSKKATPMSPRTKKSIPVLAYMAAWDAKGHLVGAPEPKTTSTWRPSR